jgi:ketosteroid isomerase-like protein
VAFALYHPDIQSIFDESMVSLGIEPVYHGREARIDMQQRWNAEWGDWQFEPEELIDLGDSRLLIIGRLKGSGLSSGAPVNHECGFLFTLSAGLAIHEQVFLDRSEALNAAGLAE